MNHGSFLKQWMGSSNMRMAVEVECRSRMTFTIWSEYNGVSSSSCIVGAAKFRW